MGSASEIDGADCASWFEAEGISHPFRQSIETLPGRKAEIYRVRIGCSKRPSNEAAGESKPEAYPLGYVEDFDEPRTKLGAFFSSRLDVEAEIDDIRFLDHIVFTFESKQSFFLHLRF